jgi:DNA repair exonuclease SbcCD ATPase subunit
MASEKVIFKKVLGFGVDAEVPSWSVFSDLRHKLKELQQGVTAGKSEFERELASMNRRLEDVIRRHNELERKTGELINQISELAKTQESLEQYRKTVAQNIASEIVPLIEAQIARFYGVAKEIESYAASTKEWMTQVSEDILSKYQALADKITTIQADASRVAGSIDALKNDTAAAELRFRQSAEDAMAAQVKQKNCIVEAITEEAKRQTDSCVSSLNSQRDEILAKVATCSQQLEDARRETERALNLLRALQEEPSRHLAVLNIAQQLNQRSWKSFWRRLVWLFLGASH